MQDRRNVLLAIGGTVLLSACQSSFFSRSLGTYWRQRGGADAYTLENVEAVPYASLALGLGKAPRAMVVLGEVRGKDLYWFAGRRMLVVTRLGRIIQTVGLPAANLGNTIFVDPDPLAGQWGREQTWRRQVDASGIYGRMLTAHWQPQQLETLPTLWGGRQALRVREDIVAEGKPWASNTFWLDPVSGACLASEQFLDAGTDYVRTQVLRPYQG